MKRFSFFAGPEEYQVEFYVEQLSDTAYAIGARSGVNALEIEVKTTEEAYSLVHSLSNFFTAVDMSIER